MPLTLNFSPDFLLFDNVEIVSYVKRDLAGTTVATYAAVQALKMESTTETVNLGPSEAVIESARWHLQSASFASKPRRGDRFTSTRYGVWEVLDAKACAFATRWACTCKKVG